CFEPDGEEGHLDARQNEQGHIKCRKARHEAPGHLEDRPQFLRLALRQHIAETWLSSQLLDRIGLNALAESTSMIDKRLSRDCPCWPKPSRKRARRPTRTTTRPSARRFRRASAAAPSSLNTRGGTGTPTPSNCWRRSRSCNQSWSRSRRRTA